MAVERIAVVSYHSSPLVEPGAGDAGGMTVYVRGLARALAQRGVRTDIFTRAAGERRRVVEMYPGVRVVTIEAGPAAHVDKEALRAYIPEFSVRIRTFAAAQRLTYDVVHSHYWHSGLAAETLSNLWAAPLVHSNHTLGHVKNSNLAPGDTPEPQVRLIGEAAVVEAADVLVASTDEELEHLCCLYGASHDRVKTLRPGVDHFLFRPGSKLRARKELGLPDDSAVLLYVGRIQALKGIDLALKAVARLDRSLAEDVLLVVAGGPSGAGGTAELVRLRNLAAELGIGDRVRFVGRQAHTSLPAYYRAADVLVLCSHCESFGLAALEAHACGIPVVGTSVGGLSYIVRDGESGWLVESRDPAEFAERCRALVTNPILSQAFGAAAARRAAEFSWDNTAVSFLDLYECLVREQAPELCTC